MATLKLYAETGSEGGCLLYTFDPPGLLARGASLEAALASAPVETTRLRRLLDGGGALDMLDEVWGEAETPQLVVQETVHRRGSVTNGMTRATFQRDLVPLTPEQLPGYLRVMSILREELWTLKDRIPPGAYEFRSLPHRKTILEQLAHVAACDRWYLGHLWPDLPRLPRSTDVWHKLVLNRELAVDTIGNMTREDMGRMKKANGEVWTGRKVIRRFLYHEKFHLDTIERDLGFYYRVSGRCQPKA